MLEEFKRAVVIAEGNTSEAENGTSLIRRFRLFFQSGSPTPEAKCIGTLARCRCEKSHDRRLACLSTTLLDELDILINLYCVEGVFLEFPDPLIEIGSV